MSRYGWAVVSCPVHLTLRSVAIPAIRSTTRLKTTSRIACTGGEQLWGTRGGRLPRAVCYTPSNRRVYGAQLSQNRPHPSSPRHGSNSAASAQVTWLGGPALSEVERSV